MTMAMSGKGSLVGNINSKLPPELLTNILQFLPFSDLKVALLVSRSVSTQNWTMRYFLQALEGVGGASKIVGEAEVAF